METYVSFSFWMGLVAIILNCILMAVQTYPVKQKDKSIGSDVAKVVIQLIFAAWAAYLLFAQ